jgi:ornithine cyclodeaminase/alanine dehydrogenase-like protein (mu-crystallin family)
MTFYNHGAVFEMLQPAEWIEAMEEAVRISPDYDRCMLKRQHIDRGENTFLIMPCIDERYWVTKLVSFCPENRKLGKPSICGTVVLNDSRTGELLAIMDGPAITALRTAAVSAVGIKYLSPEKASSLGLVGAGIQGLQQARFACQVRNIEQITVYDISRTALRNFMDRAAEEMPGVPVTAAGDATEVCFRSEIIITATNAVHPVFPEQEGLLHGKTVVAIGSYKPMNRELPVDLFTQIDRVFIDTSHGITESGDLMYPVKEGLIREADMHPLGDLLSGQVGPGHSPTRLFKTTGSAVYDLYAAVLVYEKGKSMGK